ncbi:MAG: hypothetical protein HGA31_06545 [Candidatus Moranbacteria bacterium]|nr:hypothetical protein [Candidatus Moranbacteria bacterium]
MRFLLFFVSVPVIGLVTLSMSRHGQDGNIPVVIVLYGIGVFTFLGQEYSKAKREAAIAREKRRQDMAVSKEQLKADMLVFRFKNCFGFDPKFISEKRFQKEALIKLAFLAKELKRLSLEREKRDAFLIRMHYDEIFARYQRGFELLTLCAPAFASTLPHWTHLWEFAERWCRENSFEARLGIE